MRQTGFMEPERFFRENLTEYKTDLIEENKDRMCYENVEVQQWDALVEDESLLESVDVLTCRSSL